ncbi:hypothetical protein JKF63_07562 [Porcisia hertigi]|uniref:Uncharacterized protein n=1 Tax=Porcisia hertigi TaxID=2761500 RepID=A0A836LM53_9TRYP|nr:hypothetical protein JKF63_07562 [Porcisia hertigi]
MAVRKRLELLFTDIALFIIFLLVTWWLLSLLKHPLPASEAQLVRRLGQHPHPLSVIVHHDHPVCGLNIASLHKRRRASCSPGKNDATESCNEPLRMLPYMLPAWTLRVVDPNCTDCTDVDTVDAALGDQFLTAGYAVFATPAAPLGRVGPMLLAMASVTDDVDVRAELQHWEWLRYVYGAGFPTVDGHAEAGAHRVAPYLAVLGIPSTDQPARAALREAQRQTWLTYQEVARRDNRFTGALLPLYLFAAVEPLIDRNASIDDASVAQDHAATSVARKGGMRILLPTTTEYRAASDALMKIARSGNVSHDVSDMGYAQRRVELRKDWRFAAVDDTPCASIITTRTNGSPSTSALSYLSSALSVPVTPAFTSPAELICLASSALWQEALTHRNVLWIDMMTDRRPTTNKRLGEDGKWGLPVEVGMSQKLILWLEYAYHAFPTVPFIIKGDDDAYVKVPQFLSDVRYVMGGTQVRQPPPPLSRPRRSKVDAQSTVTEFAEQALSNTSSLVEDTECVYWGSVRHHLHTQFCAGMMFMLHRKVVQGLLEPKDTTKRLSVVRLAADEFTGKRESAYRRLMFHHEDILIGLQIYRSLTRVKELCPTGRLWYVKEWYARFHDMHVGRTHNVTWSTVVAHRCHPSDAYFLHYFFRNEYRVVESARRYNTEEEHEAAAVAETNKWLANMRRDPSMRDVNWSILPEVQWVYNVSRRPTFMLSEADGVAVYNNPYEYWRHEATNVQDGYRSLPQW